jgi:hypothetical protein
MLAALRVAQRDMCRGEPMQLLEWQYLLFLAPIGLGALYLLVMAAGLVGEGGDADAGVDADTDLAVDVDADADLGDAGDLGVDADADADVGAALDHDADVTAGDAGDHEADLAHAADAAPGVFTAVATLLGIGKVPVSLLLLTYLLVWGGAGLITLTLVGQQQVWIAIVVAAAAALLVPRQLAGIVARLVPAFETYSMPARGLLGLTGLVLYRVTADSGTVRVHEPGGTFRDVPGRTAEGVESIPADTPVVLLRYDPRTEIYIVAPRALRRAENTPRASE